MFGSSHKRDRLSTLRSLVVRRVGVSLSFTIKSHKWSTCATWLSIVAHWHVSVHEKKKCLEKFLYTYIENNKKIRKIGESQFWGEIGHFDPPCSKWRGKKKKKKKGKEKKREKKRLVFWKWVSEKVEICP